ncbi:MAG: hypothetical protein IPH80_30520 [Myxococcales bacterium]|nr:hypothetical protein [Myxococcales bacterium]
MAPPSLDRARLQALLADAGAQLDGEWLLIGGAAAAAWFADARTTDWPAGPRLPRRSLVDSWRRRGLARGRAFG